MRYHAENKQLLHEYKIYKDSEILGDLYELNKGLFYKIASKYIGLSEREDLLQECYFALIKAVNDYNESLGEFSSYLSKVTTNHLQQYVNKDNLITAPDYMQLLAYKYNCMRAQGRSDTEIINHLEISREQFDILKRFIVIQKVSSLDAVVPGDDERTLCDIIPDRTDIEEQITERVYNYELAAALNVSAEILSDRERSYLFKRYYDNMSYKEIDPDHSGTNTRIIIERALRKLRNNETLQRFYQEMNLYSCNSFSYFKRYNTSGVERAVIVNTYKKGNNNMAKKGLVLRRAEIKKMLQSEEIVEACKEQAEIIQANAQAISGEEYGVRQVKLKTRVGYNVYPETAKAKKDNLENNTLLHSVE